MNEEMKMKLFNEAKMLRSILNRMIVTKNEKELLKMYEAAEIKLQTIHKERVKELDMLNEAKTSKRKGRPKADYICAISKHVCPFNDDFWELGGADAAASDNCPIQSYENSNRIKSDGTKVIRDWCKHLMPRT